MQHLFCFFEMFHGIHGSAKVVKCGSFLMKIIQFTRDFQLMPKIFRTFLLLPHKTRGDPQRIQTDHDLCLISRALEIRKACFQGWKRFIGFSHIAQIQCFVREQLHDQFPALIERQVVRAIGRVELFQCALHQIETFAVTSLNIEIALGEMHQPRKRSDIFLFACPHPRSAHVFKIIPHHRK